VAISKYPKGNTTARMSWEKIQRIPKSLSNQQVMTGRTYSVGTFPAAADIMKIGIQTVRGFCCQQHDGVSIQTTFLGEFPNPALA